MALIRDAYVVAAQSVVELLGEPEVASTWEAPSALAEWSVGGLAGHLAGQVFTVVELVQAPVPSEAAIRLDEHYDRAAWVTAALDDDVSVGIRHGGDRNAAAGPAELLARTADACALVAQLLPAQPSDRSVLLPWQGWALSLDDFLVTRMMEIAVHSDDLAVSAGIDAPELPSQVLDPVLALLTRLALRRHGQSAVLCALTRDERAPESIAAF